jgi:hypothetical protein
MNTTLRVLQLLALVLGIICMIGLIVWGIRIESLISNLSNPSPGFVPACSSIDPAAREGTNCDPLR